jgi:hypothetical protein
MKAMKALNDAIRFHKEQPLFKGLRSFLDKYTSTLVSILLYALNMGDIDTSEKENIRLCLESVLEVVGDDLKKACEDDGRCYTLPAVVEIFDVTGYNEADRFNLTRKFQTSILPHLGIYLLNKASVRLGDYIEEEKLGTTSDFPSFHLINVILKVVAQTFGYSNNKHHTIPIARAVMFYIESLGENELVSLGDDVIDVCGGAKKIYHIRRLIMDQKGYEEMTEFNELHQKFVLKLLRVPSVEIKMLAFAELTSKSAGLKSDPNIIAHQEDYSQYFPCSCRNH